MKILKNISLKQYNTFGIDVNAAEYAEVADAESLKGLIRAGRLKDASYLILGGGSNVLFTGDYDGLVIRNMIVGIRMKEVDDSQVLVTAGAGVVWDYLLHYCIEHDLGGIENLISIPGSVGAGPIQNIGAYGVELKDTFHSLDAIEIATGELRTFYKEECEFGYRDSIFKREQKGKFIIVSVSLMLKSKSKPDISYGAISEELIKMGIHDGPAIGDVGKAISSIRHRKLPDPENIGNAGSFFKNPLIVAEKYAEIREQYPDAPSYKAGDGMVKVPAGWLIEQCGWKGKRHGSAGVHDKQALVLINTGNASGKEVLELAGQIMDSVNDRFGLSLEMEVNVI